MLSITVSSVLFLAFWSCSAASVNPDIPNADQFQCKSKGRYADPLDCTKYYVCIINPTENPAGATFIVTKRKCPGGFFWNQKARNGFGNCVPITSDTKACNPHACPEGMFFDDKKRQCVNTNGLPPCNTIGAFVNEDDCIQYYTCISATNGWIQKKFRCNETGENLMYNEATGQCEDPCNWKADQFQCISEGRYADPLDCTQFYECIIDPTEKPAGVAFIVTKIGCPDGFLWKQKARNGLTGFGHCVSITSDTKACNPIVANKCSVPLGWCGAAGSK